MERVCGRNDGEESCLCGWAVDNMVECVCLTEEEVQWVSTTCEHCGCRVPDNGVGEDARLRVEWDREIRRVCATCAPVLIREEESRIFWRAVDPPRCYECGAEGEWYAGICFPCAAEPYGYLWEREQEERMYGYTNW
jgi:hypothetical protein